MDDNGKEVTDDKRKVVFGYKMKALTCENR